MGATAVFVAGGRRHVAARLPRASTSFISATDDTVEETAEGKTTEPSGLSRASTCMLFPSRS